MEIASMTMTRTTGAKKKIKSARKDAKTQRTRKAFLCGTFAALRLCVKVFAFLQRLNS
jgi:hypothetical protein